jgi:hypothetical protein
MSTPVFYIGDKVKCIIKDILPGNKYGPDLELDNSEYIVRNIVTCGCGRQHLDVGLPSYLEYVSCYECNEELTQGTVIHWCHASRFVKF